MTGDRYRMNWATSTNLSVLSLYSNELTGEIPPELGGLTSLQGLALHVNELTGEIPPELGNLDQPDDTGPLCEPVDRGDSGPIG